MVPPLYSMPTRRAETISRKMPEPVSKIAR
jgi:hypothetical protein